MAGIVENMKPVQLLDSFEHPKQMLQWMDNDHGLCDRPMFTIGRSSKSQPWF